MLFVLKTSENQQKFLFANNIYKSSNFGFFVGWTGRGSVKSQNKSRGYEGNNSNTSPEWMSEFSPLLNFDLTLLWHLNTWSENVTWVRKCCCDLWTQFLFLFFRLQNWVVFRCLQRPEIFFFWVCLSWPGINTHQIYLHTVPLNIRCWWVLSDHWEWIWRCWCRLKFTTETENKIKWICRNDKNLKQVQVQVSRHYGK